RCPSSKSISTSSISRISVEKSPNPAPRYRPELSSAAAGPAASMPQSAASIPMRSTRCSLSRVGNGPLSKVRAMREAARDLGERILAAVHDVLREQKPARIPRLARHPARLQRSPVKPLRKAPAADGARARELRKLRPRERPASRAHERDHPERADHRPDAAVVILPFEVLPVPGHVRTPQHAGALNRLHDGTDRVRIMHTRREQRVEREAGRSAVRRPGKDRKQVAEDVALLPEEREVDEAEEQIPVPPCTGRSRSAA